MAETPTHLHMVIKMTCLAAEGLLSSSELLSLRQGAWKQVSRLLSLTGNSRSDKNVL